MFDFKKCYSSDGTEFAGLYEIQPKVFGDSRGYFLETFSTFLEKVQKSVFVSLGLYVPMYSPPFPPPISNHLRAYDSSNLGTKQTLHSEGSRQIQNQA